MEYGKVAGIPIPISRLVQGTTVFGAVEDDGQYAFDLMDAVFELGCNAFDTAHVYGPRCQCPLGKWANDRGVRDKVVIIDKGAHHNGFRRRVTPYDITSDLHDCLARLGTDYIDLFLLHRDDPNVPVEPIVDVLNEHIQAGLIRAYGGSNWSHTRLAEANAYAEKNGLVPFAASSPNFTLAIQVEEPWENCVTITGPDNADARAWYAESRLPVFAWSSLAGGFMSGQHTPDAIRNWPPDDDALLIRCYRCEESIARLERAGELAKAKGASVPQIALAYALQQPFDVYALVACRSREEFAVNAAVFGITLTDEEVAFLEG